MSFRCVRWGVIFMINACTGGLWGMASLWGMLDGLRNARIATMSSEATKELDMIVYSERCQNLYIKCWTECSSLRCMVNSTKAHSFLVYWPSFSFIQPICSSIFSRCARSLELSTSTALELSASTESVVRGPVKEISNRISRGVYYSTVKSRELDKSIII